MPYEPIIPKGHHLGTSHEVDGAVKGHIFEDGTNALKGHADWVWVDDPEPSYSYSYTPEPPRQLTEEERRIAAELSAALVVLTIKGVKWAAPRMARWWRGTAARGIKSTWRKVTTLRKSSKDLAAGAPSSSSNARFVASSTGVEIAVAESKITMSSAEWEARYQAMLAAGAFTEQQRRILADAQIDDSTPALDAESTKEQLTPRQFADRIARMLEANPSLLNDETPESVMALLGRGATSLMPMRFGKPFRSNCPRHGRRQARTWMTTGSLGHAASQISTCRGLEPRRWSAWGAGGGLIRAEPRAPSAASPCAASKKTPSRTMSLLASRRGIAIRRHS